MQKTQGLSYEEIRKTILEKIPPEVGITRIEFEGPRLAIYTQKPEILAEQSHIIGEIASVIKKRIVIRSDPSVRANEAEGERAIREVLVDAGLLIGEKRGRWVWWRVDQGRLAAIRKTLGG